MKNMTTAQLIESARKYDNAMNEGGEGYNPYREELARREMEAESNRPKTLADRKASVLRALEIKDCSVARECGTYDQSEIDALRTELKEIEAAEEKARWDEWDIETTKTRRIEWNDFIRSLGELDGLKMQQVYAKEREQGWTIEDLKTAIKHHSL